MAQMVKRLSTMRRPWFDPWVGKISWRRKWQPTPVFLPGKSHGWRSLVGYSPWGRRIGHNWATSLSLSLCARHLGYSWLLFHEFITLLLHFFSLPSFLTACYLHIQTKTELLAQGGGSLRAGWTKIASKYQRKKRQPSACWCGFAWAVNK